MVLLATVVQGGGKFRRQEVQRIRGASTVHGKRGCSERKTNGGEYWHSLEALIVRRTGQTGGPGSDLKAKQACEREGETLSWGQSSRKRREVRPWEAEFLIDKNVEKWMGKTPGSSGLTGRETPYGILHHYENGRQETQCHGEAVHETNKGARGQ